MAIFFAPLALFVGTFETIFWRSGECWPRSWVVEELTKHPDTIFARRFFSQDFREIKLALIQRKNCDILAIGSSRAMQCRDIMFGPLSNRFYNLGGTVDRASYLIALCRMLTDGQLPKPKVVIFNIDNWWLKAGTHKWLKADISSLFFSKDETLTLGAHIAGIRGMLAAPDKQWDVLRLDKSLRDPEFGHSAIGLAALRGDGFRSDGSLFCRDYILEFLKSPHYRDRETPPIAERVRTHGFQYSSSAGLDPETIAQVIAALQSLQKSGIEVYTYLPPVSSEVDAICTSSADLKNWHESFYGAFADQLRAAGIPCVSVRTPAHYGLGDEYMFDGIHPSDVLMTYILEELVRSAPPTSILKAIPADYLKELRERPGVMPLSLDSLPEIAKTK